ncbi:MAG: FHA domain-containing protein [Phycisphaerales bacterium]|nr:FHA domain-containing protein [Phycisphaerales bacterium]
MASLIIIAGPNEGECYSVDTDVTVIGRGDDCQIQLADERASRNHSKVTLDTSAMVPGTSVPLKRFVLEDMGSSNGTSLNGQILKAGMVMADGQVIGIGGTQVLFTTRDYANSEDALKEITRIGQGTLADAATNWPTSDSWREERTLTD